VIETCAQCGFDGSEYTHLDLLGTLRAITPMWRTMTEGMPPSILSARPAAQRWSATEYAAHSCDVTEVMGRLVHFALTSDDPRIDGPLPEPPTPRPAPTLNETLTLLESNTARLHAAALKLSEEDWDRPLRLGDDSMDVTWVVAHAVHDATHHLRDVGRGIARLGAGAARQHGTVVQVSASGGGVPKAAVPSAVVSRRGLDGDAQAERRHHGRPWQALCLWSVEVIDDLRTEGHSVHPGAAGENITVSGIDWATIRPGVRVQIGEAVAEISAFAEPCTKNARWFAGRNFRRMDHALHPGWSRAYAWVLQPGQVTAGDAFVVEPKAS
jgi:MOSC domain-containing protein YiiM